MQSNSSLPPIRIFICYARKDMRWFDTENEHAIVPFLVESLRKQNIQFWYDRELVASDVYMPRIFEEIDQAHIAIIIVSQAFLNSDFIEQNELPRIKNRAEQKMLSVLPILMEPCSWEEDEFLSSRQMLPGKPTPLINYTGNAAGWAQVRFDLLEGVKKLVKKIREEQSQKQEPFFESSSENGNDDEPGQNDEIEKRKDRLQKLKDTSSRLAIPDNRPAYQRRNITLDDIPPTGESNPAVKKLSINDDPLRSWNSYLHGNVD